MELKIIKTKKQYEQYLDWVDVQFNNKVKSNTPQGEKLQVALLLIKQYEDANYPIPFPDPIDAIKFKMDELGLKNKDLVGKVGSKGYVSSLLNKRKPLTLELAKLFHKNLISQLKSYCHSCNYHNSMTIKKKPCKMQGFFFIAPLMHQSCFLKSQIATSRLGRFN